MKLPIFTLVALVQLSQACIVVFEGIYTPGNGHMTAKVSSDSAEANFRPLCELNDFIGGTDSHWLNCKDDHYSWVLKDGARFAYAAHGVDYHGIPMRTPMNDGYGNIKLYWNACDTGEVWSKTW